MNREYLNYSLWLLVIGSWVFGVAYGRWFGGTEGVFGELSQAVSIPSPAGLQWWHPILFFPLTIVAAYILSQLFFGAGAAVFMFSRGVGDSALLLSLETTLKTENFLTVSTGQIWLIFFIILAVAVNLPLCLWSAQLGTARSVRMFDRLRGKPLRPEAGLASGLLLLVAISLVLGLLGSFALSYAG